MAASGKVRLRRFGLGLLATCCATIAAGAVIGPKTAMAMVAVGFLASVFVADDGAGTFFPLAIMFVIATVLLLAALLATVAVNL